MAKLKDIFPRWLFKERGFGDLEVGGGSAFAHLTEDAADDLLRSDYGLLLGSDADFESYWNGDGTGQVTEIEPGNLTLQDSLGRMEFRPGDNGFVMGTMPHPFFRAAPDGSLHWGDGTVAPDTHAQRVDGGLWFGAVDLSEGLGLYQTGFIGIYPSTPQAVLETSLNTDAGPRFHLSSQGDIGLGDGSGALDVQIKRSAAKTLNLTNDTNDLVLKVNGVAVTVP